MVLEGVVTNVAAFGAFVDVGVHQDGLVHVSAMSKTFVKDPRAVVKPGDVVRVKVLEVDKPRKRISLTLRLDDEAGSQPARSARPDGGGASRRDQARTPSAKAAAPGNAMADALRRAGLGAATEGALSSATITPSLVFRKERLAKKVRCRVAAVGGNRLPCQEATFIAGEKADDGRDVLDRSQAAERRASDAGAPFDRAVTHCALGRHGRRRHAD